MLAFERQKQLRRARRFFIRHAGNRLVEQQQLRVLHQQHADFEPLLLPVAQVPGQPVHAANELNRHQHFRQPVALLRVELEEHRCLHALIGLERQFQVFKHRELLEHRRFLELAANAQLRNLGFLVAQQINRAAEKHRAFIGPGLAGDDVHHGCLARAVRADDAAQLARCDVQAQLVDGLEAVEADADIFEVQDAAMRHIDFARRGDAARAGVAPTRFGVACAAQQRAVRLHPARALFQKVGGHCSPPLRSFFTSPTTPLGKNKVTPMNNAPRKYSQNSG